MAVPHELSQKLLHNTILAPASVLASRQESKNQYLLHRIFYKAFQQQSLIKMIFDNIDQANY
jgi:hypothetical protein